MQKARKINLRAKGVFAGIVERKVRGQSKLRPKQSRTYYPEESAVLTKILRNSN